MSFRVFMRGLEFRLPCRLQNAPERDAGNSCLATPRASQALARSD
jgi:hypothetical protein